MEKVFVSDTTLRDGEQAPGCHLRPEQKLAIAKQLHKLGVDAIEAGFPVSSPAELGAVRKIAETVGRAENAPVITAFGRCVDKDIEACWQAIEPAHRRRIHVFIASSDIHLEHKLRKSRDEALEQAVKGVAFAKSFVADVQFTPEDASRADRAYLAQMVEAVIDAGATTINVADTVGYATPDEFVGLIRYLQTNVRNICHARLSVHCHDDLGMAVANSLAAVRAGVEQIDCTVNGVGERAGNCSLEEVVMALKTRADFFGRRTTVNTPELYATSQMVARAMNMAVPANKAVVGGNAFSHGSGIHQDGMLKNRSTYEIMRAEDVGAPGTSLPLTNRSGRRALETKIRQLGYRMSQENFETFFRKFKIFADTRRFVSDRDMQRLLMEI